MTPLNDALLISDMALDLGLPLLIVARTELGTINHTLLTVEHAGSRGLPVAGIVFNRSRDGRMGRAEKTAPAEVAARTSAPVLGVLPRLERLDRENLLEAGRRLLRRMRARKR